MVNTISEGDQNLVNLNYTSLLNAILKYLKNSQANNPYRISKNGKHLHINIDEIAYTLATKQDSKIEPPLSIWQGARVATTNFSESSRDNFVEKIREIRDYLQQYLELLLKEQNYDSLENFIRSFYKLLTEFQGNVNNKISLEYDFEKKYLGLSKQRLTLMQEDGDIPLLKFHRLTITIKNTKDIFDIQLKESIENYIHSQFEDDNNQDDLKDILDDLYKSRDQKDSDWYAIKRLMDTEAIAKVQRTAKIKYLEYLLEHIGTHSDAIYLELLIHRLKELERYLDDPDKTDGDYQVSYNGESFNIKEIFSCTKVFDKLPIIPRVDGSLGKIRDENKGELSFTFGLKLKFGGKIQTEEGKTVLDYNLELLDPDSERNQEELANESKRKGCVKRIIQIAVLYYFVFAGNNPSELGYNPNSDLDYNVIEKFEQNILPILKSSDKKRKKGLFKGIIKGIKQYNAHDKIDKLRTLLQSQIKIKKSRLWSSRAYPIQINIKKGVLETEASKIDKRNTFFRDGIREKAALKYISVGDATIDTSSLCYFSGDIKISEIGYFDTADNQAFSMEYSKIYVNTIPTILYPEESDRKSIKREFRERNLIIFAYQQERLKQNIFNGDNPKTEFIYRFVFSLLSHISLKNLLDTAQDKLNLRLFIPILRLHLGDKNNPLAEEVFFRSNFVVLSHLINDYHHSSSQGISVKKTNNFKIKNALASLYSVLPKKFVLNNNLSNPKIHKLAIIIVSSRECDRSWQGNYKISNLTAEVIKINRQQDGSIVVYTRKTISNHYNSRQIYQDPDVIVGEVDRLYQDGYRHILYIAKSPYSQTLNLTADDDLYFMSAPVIRNLKGNKEDLKIYPVLFDNYYVVSWRNIGRKSLYIQDAEELTDIVNDPTRQVAVFFNLFNGIKIGKPEERYYNGVISYSTLLNVYEQNIVDTGEIYADLINNDYGRGIKT